MTTELTTWLLCLDPGKASGCAIINTTPLQSDRKSPVSIVFSGEIQPDDLNDWLLETFKLAAKDGIGLECVCEDFIITPQTGKNSAAPWSLKKIGVLEFLGWLYKVPITFQTPAAAKSFVTNERLKSVGLWHKGGAGHANDALRHGALFLVSKKGWDHPGLIISG